MKKIITAALIVCASLMSFVTALAQGFVHAEGKKVVDINGNELILRGHAPGGWMIQEPYMMEMSGFTSSQHEIRRKIESVLGEELTEEFYQKWLDNGFRREDVKLLAETGFNSIRLPMHYKVLTLPIEDEPVKGENTWLESGFKRVDDVLSWCKEFNIYLILDLHGGPGGQGHDSNISDYDGTKPSLWESEDNQNKMIALWKKLAERYADEQYIGGYDLLNEPNWGFEGSENGCNETSNAPIWNLYKKVIEAIRTVDKNHMLILEGNCWCNSYNGLPTVRNWDNNICLEFHKYWNLNDKSTIQGIINLRDSQNVPIWCGESGENSTKWYTDAIRLLEENGIGWSWWTWKKIGSHSGICTVTAPTAYKALKNYWQNGGNKPSQESAKRTLFALADAYLLENCFVNRDVADALLRQPHTTECVAYAENKVPGTIYAPDYDLGRYGVAYYDVDVEDVHNSSGDYVSYDKGGQYRGDGVDISTTKDTYSNGYYVGWTEPGEWLTYTLDVEETAAYTLSIRYSSTNAKTIMAFEVDGVAVTSDVTLASTGSWEVFRTTNVPNIVLSAGKHVLKVTTVSGGANLVSYVFSDPVSTATVDFQAVRATTSEDGKHILLSLNKDVAAGGITASDFSVKSSSKPMAIENVAVSSFSNKAIDITLASKVYRDNALTLSYNGTAIKGEDGASLPAFNDMTVNNIAPVRFTIPGQINVEDYCYQSGLSFEKCDDTSGGSTNFAYTDPGDYVDFLVNITGAGIYSFEFRVAAMYAGGKFEIQLFDDDNNKTVVGSYSVGSSGGWQSWKTQTAKAKLPEGTYRLRIYIVNKEFNMNWFSFAATSGIGEVTLAPIRVYPNPCHDVAYVNTSNMSGKGVVGVYNTSGKKQFSREYSLGDNIAINMQDLASGMYVVRLYTNNKVYTQKIIKE